MKKTKRESAVSGVSEKKKLVLSVMRQVAGVVAAQSASANNFRIASMESLRSLAEELYAVTRNPDTTLWSWSHINEVLERIDGCRKARIARALDMHDDRNRLISISKVLVTFGLAKDIKEADDMLGEVYEAALKREIASYEKGVTELKKRRKAKGGRVD